MIIGEVTVIGEACTPGDHGVWVSDVNYERWWWCELQEGEQAENSPLIIEYGKINHCITQTWRTILNSIHNHIYSWWNVDILKLSFHNYFFGGLIKKLPQPNRSWEETFWWSVSNIIHKPQHQLGITNITNGKNFKKRTRSWFLAWMNLRTIAGL